MNTLVKKALRPAYQLISRLSSAFDSVFLADDVPTSSRICHSQWREFLYGMGNEPGKRVLEVGSREVCGPSQARNRLSKAEYVGFDYYEGPNVDVAGDAHKLSTYFPGEQFDIVFSSACFEHFAMPWVVAREIAKVLKVGGLVFVETHFCFSSHERPWHFFHFTDMGLRALFPEAMGFECVEASMSDPIVGRFSRFSSQYLRYREVQRMYCFSQYLGRKTKNVAPIDWGDLELREVVGDTFYPPKDSTTPRNSR